jgi:hypothetical protein
MQQVPIFFSNPSIKQAAIQLSTQTQQIPTLGDRLITCISSFSSSSPPPATATAAATNTKEIESTSINSFTEFITSRWPMAHIKDWSGGNRPHVGDMWITWPGLQHKTLMVEMKNWSRTIPSSEIQKFWNDWDQNHHTLHGALFLSWNNTKITSCKPLEITYWGPHRKPILFMTNISQNYLLLEQCIEFMLSDHTNHNPFPSFLKQLSSQLSSEISTLTSEIAHHKRSATLKSKQLTKCQQSLSLLDAFITSSSHITSYTDNTNYTDNNIEII